MKGEGCKGTSSLVFDKFPLLSLNFLMKDLGQEIGFFLWDFELPHFIEPQLFSLALKQSNESLSTLMGGTHIPKMSSM
jgi:hypothetical protein